MTNKLQNKLHILKHPLVEHNLATIRNVEYNPESFHVALKRILRPLLYEGLKCLPTVEKEINTPLCTTVASVLDENIKVIFAPILRAGLVFSDIAQEILPDSTIQHLGMYRDEKTLTPVWYYNRSHEQLSSPKETYVFILDPMIATGNSLCDAIEYYRKQNVPQENIVCISLLCAPEGLEKLYEKFSQITVVTAEVDIGLNARGYIVPGLGDAGDKAFNTLV